MTRTDFSSAAFYRVVTKALELPEDFDLRPEMRPEEVPGWDSLMWLKVIEAVEEEWTLSFPLETLTDIAKVEDFEKITKSLLSKEVAR